MIEIRLRALLEALLRLPLLLKLVVANTAVLVLGVGVTAWILSTAAANTDPGSAPALLAGAVLVTLALGVLTNTVVVHLALSPLRRMEETATRIDRGREDARVGASSIADPQLGRLMRRFDQILDTLTEARERQQVAASLLVDAEERVRMRIADDLYGDVGQRLAAVLLLLGRVARSSPEERASRESAGVLGRIQDELAQVLEGVRKTARHLRPPELDDLGIMAAIQAEIRTLEARARVPVTLESGPAELPLGQPEGLVLFRLIQEGLSLVLEGRTGADAPAEDGNGARPASPGAVTVAMETSDDSIQCDIESDGPIGRGLSHGLEETMILAAGARSGDPGNPRGREWTDPRLEPMRERAAWIGGSVRVLQRRPTGSLLRIRIPASRRHTDPHEETGASPRRISA